MPALTKDSHTAYVWGAWLVLMALTAASWWVSADHEIAALGLKLSMVSILVLTFAKIFVVGHVFMEIRESAPWLMRLFLTWCIGLCVTLSVLYLLIGPATA
jgi:hypothetical protein